MPSIVYNFQVVRRAAFCRSGLFTGQLDRDFAQQEDLLVCSLQPDTAGQLFDCWQVQFLR